MSLKKKFSLGVALTLATTSLLVGCGNNSTNEASSNGKTVLKIWGMGEEGKLLSKIESDFETKYPDIDMQVQALPWDQAHDKLLMAVASGDGPDVVQMGTSWIPEFADAGALMDFTPYLEQYPNLAQDKYFPGSIEAGTYDNKYVGVPWYIDTRVLYYRTDLLAEVGFEDGPNTWEEMKEASDKLAARGEGMYGVSLDPKDQFFAITYGWQNGAQILDGNTPMFTQPEFIEAVEYINSFFVDGAAPILSDLDINQAFKEGITPMFISGPWMVPLLKQNVPEIDGKWAVRTLPAKKTNTSFVGGANFTVFESSKNKEAALKFIDYMSDVETQMKWMEISSSLPSRTEAWENEKLKNDTFYSVFGEQMQNAKPSPVHVKWETIAQELNATLEKINVGGADINQELEALNKKATEIMN